jgi:N6-adenosine-specific RNA methylase IME4
MKPLAANKSLAKYEAACRAVAEARTVDAAKGLRDEAEAMRVLARQANNRELEIDCAEIRVRAERRLGELLIAAKAAGQVKRGRSAKDAPAPVKLEDVGIGRKLSMRSQKLAAIKAPLFEARLAALREELCCRDGRVSLDIVGGLAKEDREAARKADYQSRIVKGCTVADLEKLAADGARYGLVYADPNWEFRAWSSKGSGRSASQHYETAPDDDILAFGPIIGALALPDAMFLCWATGPQFPLALELIGAAGFKYQTFGFSWSKLNKSVDAAEPFAVDDFFMGQGHWTRANEEICILATRGAPERLNADVRQKVIAPLGRHSEKPKIHDRIERLVAGPYLELFARAPVKNWTVWGNEILRTDFLEAAA